MPSCYPLLSVIVATRNCSGTLERCLLSVVNQTYPKKELIVIDGASTDGTVDIIKSQEKSVTYWESEPDTGIYEAWNKGLNRMKGDWVCFLGSDDWLFRDDVLGCAASHLQACPPEIRIAYGNVMLVGPEGEALEMLGKAWPIARLELRNRCSIPIPGTFFRSETFAIHGRFDETFRISGDYDFILRELINNEAIFMDDVVVSRFSYGGASSRSDLTVRVKFEEARARRHNRVFPYPPIWWWELGKAFAYRFLSRTVGTRRASLVRNTYRGLAGSRPMPVPKDP